jgi:hypothetical protein
LITQGHLQGHWQRDWIKAPGFEDATTRVHWLQAGPLFADLRISADRPDIAGLSCLADLDAPALRMLMNAEGFAGDITVEENTCTWHRRINWHGLPAQSDIGLLSFDDAGGLIEDGVLAEYRELWQAVPQQPLRSANVTCGEMRGVLIENDAVFLLGIGAEPRGTTQDLITALDSGTAENTALHQHFASVYTLGRWDGARGIAELSTNPFVEGQVALEHGGDLLWHSIAFDGHCKVRALVRE